MRIAIPTFGARVSPRFDCAAAFRIIECVDKKVVDDQEIGATGLGGNSRVRLLLDRQVDVLLTGGIRQLDLLVVQENGIDVVAGLAGEVEDVVPAYLAGGSRLMSFSCGRRGQRRGRCQGRRGRGMGEAR